MNEHFLSCLLQVQFLYKFITYLVADMFNELRAWGIHALNADKRKEAKEQYDAQMNS